PILREVAKVMRDEPISPEDVVRWYHLGLIIAMESYDDATHNVWLSRVEHHSREVGALLVLRNALQSRAKQHLRAGQFGAAEMTYDEVVDIARMIDGRPAYFELMKVQLYAWRGQVSETRATAALLRELSAAHGAAAGVGIADLAVATL